jgi:hypothetical protein
MSQYFISYDLRNNRNYDELYQVLETKLNAKRILESTWTFQRTNTTPEELRNFFLTFIDEDDGIIITSIDGAAGFNTLNQL